MKKNSNDFIKICAIIAAGGIMDLSSDDKIKKYNMDKPDKVLKLFKGIKKKAEELP